jgi:hypothetical protein
MRNATICPLTYIYRSMMMMKTFDIGAYIHTYISSLTLSVYLST